MSSSRVHTSLIDASRPSAFSADAASAAMSPVGCARRPKLPPAKSTFTFTLSCGRPIVSAITLWSMPGNWQPYHASTAPFFSSTAQSIGSSGGRARDGKTNSPPNTPPPPRRPQRPSHVAPVRCRDIRRLCSRSVDRDELVSATPFGARLLPLHFEHLARFLRRPEVVRVDGDALRDGFRSGEAAHLLRRRIVEGRDLAAEAGRMLDEHRKRFRALHVDGEHRPAARLRRRIEPRQLVADEGEVLWILQLHLLRRRLLSSRFREFAEGGLA